MVVGGGYRDGKAMRFLQNLFFFLHKIIIWAKINTVSGVKGGSYCHHRPRSQLAGYTENFLFAHDALSKVIKQFNITY